MKRDNISFNVDALKNNFVKTEFSDIEMSENFLSATIRDTTFPIVTHNGMFHADDVFTVALIWLSRICFKNKYFETANPVKLKWTEVLNGLTRISSIEEIHYKTCLVVDVKNGHYDHHHVSDGDKTWWGDDAGMHPMASFGCLWNAIGGAFNIDLDDPTIVNFNVDKLLYKEFIELIDLRDLKGPEIESPISQVISNVNSYSEYDFDFVKPENFDKLDEQAKSDYKFVEAVMMAYKILRNEIIRCQNHMRSYNSITSNDAIELGSNENGVNYLKIKEVENKKDEPFIALDVIKNVNINGKPIDILINENPSIRDNSFRCVCVDTTKRSFESNACKTVEGVKFYHPQNFMVTFETKDYLNNFVKNLKILNDDTKMGI